MISIAERILQDREDLVDRLIDKKVFNRAQIHTILFFAELIAIEYEKDQADGLKNLMADVLKEMKIEE